MDSSKLEIVFDAAFYQKAFDATKAEEINKKDSTDAFAQGSLNYIV